MRSPCVFIMLCVGDGMVDSGVDMSEIFMPIPSRFCSRLRAQQLGVSPFGVCSGPPRNRPHCGCWCFCGLISSPAAMLAASSD